MVVFSEDCRFQCYIDWEAAWGGETVDLIIVDTQRGFCKEDGIRWCERLDRDDAMKYTEKNLFDFLNLFLAEIQEEE